MSDTRYLGQYRTGSIRLDGWDYRRSAWYFVTICTHRRAHHFGVIRRGVMGLSPAGCVAAQFWQRIEDLNDRAVLDAFVVMPNHVHGILGLLPRPNHATVETLDSNVSTVDSNVSTDATGAKTPDQRSRHMSRISPKAGSISTIIRSYKAAVTKRVRPALCPDFGWQPRFYDHIIRNERAFRAIRRYIENNPTQWGEDRYHSTSS
ncbi:transposase [Salisaeta longa]|uniref:transposase n=1 Tax=Salisaeta longa TaxID=503170 RepID=UPI0012F8E710|nr:transposase [Salisaeta longa]